MSPPLFEKELPSAVVRADNLPSLPAVALEVLRISQDEDATIDDMATCLSRDPALAAKLLRLANSSLFGGSQSVTTLQRATMLLGMKTVKLMALSFSLAGSLPKKGREGNFDYSTFWHRSLVCAIAARSLARLLKSPLGEEAFLCGLFANFGKLVLVRCLAAEYEPVMQEGGGWPSNALEEERLGFTSCDVAATLLKSWEFPALIYNAVASQQDPTALASAGSREAGALAQILASARNVESVLCDQDKGTPLLRLQQDLQRDFQVSESEVTALLVGLESGINETAELLAIQLPTGESYEELLNLARQQIVKVSLGTAVDLAAAQRRNQELESERKTLATRATTDRLTGLANRAAFDAFYEGEVRARLSGPVPRALGVLMVDVDHFKRFNDTHGHLAGDEVLRLVGALLDRMTRKGDLSARYGGEEFAVVVPQTNPFGLRTLAERLREALEKEALVFEGQRLSVTASFGGACLAHFDSPADAAALLKLADAHLYLAKKNGRNRCEVYGKVELPVRPAGGSSA